MIKLWYFKNSVVHRLESVTQQINHFHHDSCDFHIIHNLEKITIHWIGIVCVFHEHAKHQPIITSQRAGDGYWFYFLGSSHHFHLLRSPVTFEINAETLQQTKIDVHEFTFNPFNSFWSFCRSCMVAMEKQQIILNTVVWAMHFKTILFFSPYNTEDRSVSCFFLSLETNMCPEWVWRVSPITLFCAHLE